MNNAQIERAEITEKDRERARGLLPASAEFDGSPFVDAFAQAIAAAHARGRAEAKAEDAEIAQNELDASQRRQRGMIEEFEIGASYSATIIRDAILAPASGPSYEERVRAEIAEKVGALSRYNGIGIDSNGSLLDRDDALAAIRSGK